MDNFYFCRPHYSSRASPLRPLVLANSSIRLALQSLAVQSRLATPLPHGTGQAVAVSSIEIYSYLSSVPGPVLPGRTQLSHRKLHFGRQFADKGVVQSVASSLAWQTKPNADRPVPGPLDINLAGFVCSRVLPGLLFVFPAPQTGRNLERK